MNDLTIGLLATVPLVLLVLLIRALGRKAEASGGSCGGGCCGGCGSRPRKEEAP